MKKRTLQQVETAKRRAESFTRGVLHDEPRADEIASESVGDYAERKHLTIENPKEVRTMAISRRERELQAANTLQEQMIEQLEEELETLRGAVGQAAALLPEDEDSDESEDLDGDDGDDEEEEEEDEEAFDVHSS
jgi:hypothetical protein